LNLKQLVVSVIVLTLPLVAAAAEPSVYPSSESLHLKRTAKGTFYKKENGGFELLTGIPFDELHCKNCHSKTGQLADGRPVPHPYTPSCNDCHDFTKKPSVDSPSVCLSCHSRQRSEVVYFNKLPEPKDLSWQDLHERKGMTCISCHTGDDLHQDASGQASMLDADGIDARCENCHDGTQLTGEHHGIHGDRLACATCHTKSVLTCNNCHFDTEVAVNGKFKRPISKNRDFMFLVNRKGSGPGGIDQVYPATYQSVVYQGKAFYTLAPYTSHTITRQGKSCEECHANERIAEYDTTGTVNITKWNEKTRKLDVTTGVIPVPPDWKNALAFDFADFVGELTEPGQKDKWVFLKHGADLTQMMKAYAEPLTQEQLSKLRTPATNKEHQEVGH